MLSDLLRLLCFTTILSFFVFTCLNFNYFQHMGFSLFFSILEAWYYTRYIIVCLCVFGVFFITCSCFVDQGVKVNAVRDSVFDKFEIVWCYLCLYVCDVWQDDNCSYGC